MCFQAFVLKIVRLQLFVTDIVAKPFFFPESHWRTVPLEPKHEESGDAAAQSGQNVTRQGFPKLSLSLFVTAGKTLLEST